MSKGFDLGKKSLRKVLILLVVAVLILATGCQPTPEKPPIMNRSQGWLDEYIIESMPENEQKEVDAPAHWEETLEIRDGMITIHADIDINLPEISNTPVYELEQKEFTNEELEKLVNYFTRGEKLYKIPPLTTAELEAELKKVENVEEGYRYRGKTLPGIEQSIQRLIEEAPGTVQMEYVSPMFTYPVQSEASYINNPMKYLSNESKIKTESAFEAYVETDASFDSRITATRYDSEVGTTSCFNYQNGNIYAGTLREWYETILKREKSWLDTRMGEIADVDQEWINRQSDWISNTHQVMDAVTITPEWAQQQAEKTLRDLGITHVALSDYSKGIQFLDDNYVQYELNYMANGFEKARGGYLLNYYRDVEGLISGEQTYFTSPVMLEAYPNSPMFANEHIQIFVTEDGVQQFVWDHMSVPVYTIAENTQLLSFEEVKERFRDYMQMSQDFISTAEYEITNVELSASYITALNAPQNAWMVPVWVFEMEGKEHDPDSGWLVAAPVHRAFSAIDGGIVTGACQR